jgi:hypothetical protein
MLRQLRQSDPSVLALLAILSVQSDLGCQLLQSVLSVRLRQSGL